MVVRELITKLGFDVNDANLKRYEQSIAKVKGGVGALGAGLGSVGGLMKLIGGAVATAGITVLGKSILDTTGEVEQYRVTLGTMIGDQEKANKIIHDLDYSPVSDFYGTASAIGGLQGMVTFGMQAEQASDTLTRLGDIAQGNGEAFKSLSLNMGQVFAKGKADATDLKQFVGQGFDVVGEVSKMTGKSRAEIEKAGVTYEQCASALKHITDEGGKYHGMLKKQSQTLPGLIKQFQSVTAAIKEGIGQNILGDVKSFMNRILEDIRTYQDAIIEAGTKVFRAITKILANIYVAFMQVALKTKGFEGLRKLFGSIISILKVLGKTMLDAFMVIVPVIDKVAGWVSKLFEIIAKHKKTIIEFGKIAVAVILGIKTALGTIRLVQKIMNITDMLKNLFILMKSNPTALIIGAIVVALVLIITHLEEIKKWWDNLATPIKVVVATIAGLVGVILAVVGAVKAFTAIMAIAKAIMIAFNIICAVNPILLIIMAVIAGIALLIAGIVAIVKHWDTIKAYFQKFGNWCKQLFQKVVENIKAIWSRIKEFFVSLWDSVKSIFLAVVDWIINLWASIVSFFQNLWETIKTAFTTFVEWVGGIWDTVIEGIKNIWNSIVEFFTGLWDSVKNIFTTFVEWVGLLFENPVEAVKQAWSGITDFFQNLWENVFGIFTGFVDKVKNIWSGIKNFFGFGDSDVNVTENRNVSAVDKAMESTAGVSNSYASNIYNNSNPATINSNSNITVNVPQGTTAEQAQAISRQVQAQIDASWADMLNGSRAMVPSPEARSF